MLKHEISLYWTGFSELSPFWEGFPSTGTNLESGTATWAAQTPKNQIPELVGMYSTGKTITDYVALCYLCISFSLPPQHLVSVLVSCHHLDSSAAFLGSEKPFQQHRVTWEKRDLRREAKSSLLEMRQDEGLLTEEMSYSPGFRPFVLTCWARWLPQEWDNIKSRSLLWESLVQFGAAFLKAHLECMNFTLFFCQRLYVLLKSCDTHCLCVKVGMWHPARRFCLLCKKIKVSSHSAKSTEGKHGICQAEINWIENILYTNS